ncbi:arachidonate 12-lipoxygenase, 12R-type-like [Carettochelys insculpta]|uniref:arachidonate 12-lipoxygenase, 12R-type-like n=1 Tax=Carettochelys insculpta TaxID=44489 RepID=UPI003EBA1776
MGTYKIRVATGNYLLAGTFSSIAVTLVGSQEESEKKPLDNFGKDFTRGAVQDFKLKCQRWLGDVILVRLHKEPYSFYPSDSWYCSYVEVTSPHGQRYRFPCYQWVEGYRTLELREGKGQTVVDDTECPMLLQQRAEELKSRQERYRWKEYAPGLPHCLAEENIMNLESNDAYPFSKRASYLQRSANGQLKLRLKGFMTCNNSWAKLEDINKVISFQKTPITEYVQEHWKEDAFFGYQFLNGLHPLLIRKCIQIPENFPVTPDMVAPFLGEGTTLLHELELGNIFIVDYEILDGLPANTINGYLQYIAAPLCLLHLQPSGELVPIAIQLTQSPGPASPIFLPSDSEWDWLLAKTWVRNSDFLTQMLVSHLLSCHLLNEAFVLATLRHFPTCHPLFKLLLPHTHYTLYINTLGRNLLLKPGAAASKAFSLGVVGITELLAKALPCLTYSSLCCPDDIRERGVEAIPNYHYRDDCLKVWSAIESFVSGIVNHHYPSDAHVQADSELQAWAAEIFQQGFLGNEASGIPAFLPCISELIKYLTMWIYSCSARHASLNKGQYDFSSWMPNLPPSMRNPPAQSKGAASLESYLDTIPEVSTTALALYLLWLNTSEPGDTDFLGTYRNEHFTEEKPKQLFSDFQEQLAEISQEIQERNKSLALPYPYLDPKQISNSTSF